MKTFLIGYIIFINVLGLLLMGIDKWKAKRNRWRIPEKTLFLTALAGGSIGSLVGMYLFHHKTRKFRFSIGLPIILVLQLLMIGFFFIYQHEHMKGPSAAVSNELALIQNLDEDTIRSFVSYETMMHVEDASAKIGEETTEAVNLFFKNFQYHLHSEEITGDTATVSVEIINIDTRALARDLCMALTARNLNIPSDSQSPKTLNDYFALLRDTLKANTYELTATTAYFHLKKSNTMWIIQADEVLQDQLVSGFISWMNDSALLTPQEVLSIYLEEFASLSPQEWMDYLKIDDLFATGSEANSAAVDQAYVEKIAEYFDYTIDECTTDNDTDTATARLTITSVDMSRVLDAYKAKLLKYAHTTESITENNTALADASAGYLLEALEETAQAGSWPVTVTLQNDGRTWQLNISDELTNAFLGNMQEALETFSASVN